MSWKNKPGRRDLDAAFSYLSLLNRSESATALVQGLRTARTCDYAAKDLLRASALPLLARDESQVATDLKRIRKGRPLPPVLLIVGSMAQGVPVTVADGYHRICAVCYYDEDAPIACRIVSPQPAT